MTAQPPQPGRRALPWPLWVGAALLLLGLFAVTEIGLAIADARLRAQGWRVYADSAAGLGGSASRVGDLTADTRGQIWVALPNLGRLVAVDSRSGQVQRWPDLMPIDIEVDRRTGDVWVATADALHRFEPDSDVVLIAAAVAGLPVEARITALAVDPNGLVWLGTDGQGLYRFDPGGREPAQSVDGLWSSDHRMLQVAVDGQAQVWVRTANGLFMQAPKRSWVEEAPDGVRPNQIGRISVDGDGLVWVYDETRDRMHVYTGPGQWEVVTLPHSGQPDENGLWATGSNRRVWYYTDDQGQALDVLRRGTRQGTYTPSNSGLPEATVRALTVDDGGRLWLMTSIGLVSFDSAAAAPTAQIALIGTAQWVAVVLLVVSLAVLLLLWLGLGRRLRRAPATRRSPRPVEPESQAEFLGARRLYLFSLWSPILALGLICYGPAALIVPAIMLLLLAVAGLSRHLYVRWHAAQWALMTLPAGLIAAVLTAGLLSGSSVDATLASSCLTILAVGGWYLGNLIGLRQVVVGQCWLWAWLDARAPLPRRWPARGGAATGPAVSPPSAQPEAALPALLAPASPVDPPGREAIPQLLAAFRSGLPEARRHALLALEQLGEVEVF